MQHTGRVVSILAVVTLSASLLAACSGSMPVPTPTHSQRPTVAPTVAPQAGASANAKAFKYFVEQGVAQQGLHADTKWMLEQLFAAGFPSEGAQYSDPSTAAGMKADSTTVSIEMAGQCLIAQYGEASGSVVTSLQPRLASGGCLLGRNINNY